jgi:flagellar biosynthesis regulator FlaF
MKFINGDEVEEVISENLIDSEEKLRKFEEMNIIDVTTLQSNAREKMISNWKNYVLCNKIWPKIKEAFNLPDNAKSVELRFAVDEIVTAKVELFVSADSEKILSLELGEFYLCEKNVDKLK